MSEQTSSAPTKKQKMKKPQEIIGLPDSRGKKIGRFLLKALVVVAIGYALYLFIPFNYILNLDPITVDLFFIAILAVFVILTAFIQEGIGTDKVAKEKIKESKEI